MALDLTKSISVNALAWSLALEALEDAQDVEDAALVSLAARVSALETAGPTPTPSPAAAFTARPKFLTEATTARAGDVTGIYNGEANRGFDTVRLFRDGVDYADASAGSVAWQAADAGRQFFVRVKLKGSTVTADTQTLTIQAAVVSNRTPPRNFFAVNRVPGTNPVQVMVASDDSSINKNEDSLYYEWTSNAGQSNAKSGNKTIPLTQVDSQSDSYQTEVAFDNLDAGPFTFNSEFRGPSGAPSGFGNPLTDTLKARAQTAAVTTYDNTRKSRLITLSDGGRTAAGNSGAGEEQFAATTTARTDKRFIEFLPISLEDNGSNRWNLGVMPADAPVSASITNFPDGTVHIELPMYDGSFRAQVRAGIADGTGVFTLLFVPATSGNNGTLEVRYKGSRVMDVKSHGIANARALSSVLNFGTIRMNAGQDAFRYTPDSSFERWN